MIRGTQTLLKEETCGIALLDTCWQGTTMLKGGCKSSSASRMVQQVIGPTLAQPSLLSLDDLDRNSRERHVGVESLKKGTLF